MKWRSLRGISILEYTVFIVVLLSAFLAFRFYFTGAYNGQMRKAGESFAFGRQYDPRRSITCTYDDKLYIWYSDACYDHQVVIQDCKSKVDSNACEAWQTPLAVLNSPVTPAGPTLSFGPAPTLTIADKCAHRRCLYDAREACKDPCGQ